jgi:hypothetical protein
MGWGLRVEGQVLVMQTLLDTRSLIDRVRRNTIAKHGDDVTFGAWAGASGTDCVCVCNAVRARHSGRSAHTERLGALETTKKCDNQFMRRMFLSAAQHRLGSRHEVDQPERSLQIIPHGCY